jgi:hypothetical protein
MTVLDAPSKVQFQLEALLEVLNDEWKVSAIESGHVFYHQLTYAVGKRYYKIIANDDPGAHRSVWMFVDRKTGECYKPASWLQPAKGVRYQLADLVENWEKCDPYGSFLYIR